MTMGAVMIYSGNVVPGKEDEFNKWYDEHHIPLFSSKLPGVRNVRRFYSSKSDPQFVTIYGFDSFDDLKRALSSEESKAAGRDADAQAGVLIKSSKYSIYNEVYPK
jgi:uncharacterized protein (TIGR02118 family)